MHAAFDIFDECAVRGGGECDFEWHRGGGGGGGGDGGAPPISKIALANYSGSGRDLIRLILAVRLRNTAVRTTALSHICGTECFAIFVLWPGVMGRVGDLMASCLCRADGLKRLLRDITMEKCKY